MKTRYEFKNRDVMWVKSSDDKNMLIVKFIALCLRSILFTETWKFYGKLFSYTKKNNVYILLSAVQYINQPANNWQVLEKASHRRE